MAEPRNEAVVGVIVGREQELQVDEVDKVQVGQSGVGDVAAAFEAKEEFRIGMVGT